ncbi:heavy metal-associated domain-containing protein [Haematococcus lacustris]|nr:hypothetical protein QJQ45_001747 [Haematococcus lacustris]
MSTAPEVFLKVDMMCDGCVGAVKRVLSRLDGVESVDVSLEQQKVTVKGSVSMDQLVSTIAKTGKKVEPWPQ